MDEGNDDFEQLTEINVEVAPLEGDLGSAVLVHGVLPEETSTLVQALLSFVITTCYEGGLNFTDMVELAKDLTPTRDPSSLH